MPILRPFIFWIAFEEDLQNDPASDRYHNYQCLILAADSAVALAWGKQLANALIQSGEAVCILRTWVELMVAGAITPTGLQHIDWQHLNLTNTGTYYQGTADLQNGTPSDPAINGLIQALTLDQARTLWQEYLLHHYPDYLMSTCSPWEVPIICAGQFVEW